ncbi:hypothetical protein L842_2743 [Mycobacterium intracellulare MIN_052511_1280]|nr:hypothetical protein L842_2743 [Mycobacterium intracellulare MIN_052511_1280]
MPAARRSFRCLVTERTRLLPSLLPYASPGDGAAAPTARGGAGVGAGNRR